MPRGSISSDVSGIGYSFIGIGDGGGSAQAEERKKLTPSKVNFTFNAGAQRATLQIWKGKNNQILSKVTQSNLCMGAEITFAK